MPNEQGSIEIPVSITRWGGMMSNIPLKAIPVDSWSFLLNMDFRNPFKISSRQGSVEFVPTSTGGAGIQILCQYEYYPSSLGSPRQVVGTSNGKLYWFDSSTPTTWNLIGNLVNTTPSSISMAMLADKLYIADGSTGYSYDGTTLVDMKASGLFPTTIPALGNIVDVIATRDRIWWLESSGDWLFTCVPNSPDDLLTSSLGSYKVQVSYNDGMDGMSLCRWGNTLIINKGNRLTGQYAMYWVKGIGTSDDPFTIDPLFGDSKIAVAFAGKSGIQMGGDVIGLTTDGLVTISAVNNFKEAYPSSISLDIDDVIQRINWDYDYKITAVYDNVAKQYMCAVPLDGASSCNYVIVLSRIYDPSEGQVTYRLSLYNNWTVRCWAKIRRNLYYGNENGQIIKVRTGDNDLGAGYQKIAEAGNFHFDGPDIRKLFKSIEVDVEHNGDYTVDFSWVIDDFNKTAQSVGLTMDPKANVWDSFFWDQDYWDILGSSIRTVYIQNRGRFIRPKFYNDEADQPYSINSMVYRMVKKDAGSTKV